MQWSEVVDNPYFENLPFKIELNRYGKIEMTPCLLEAGSFAVKVQLYLQAGAKEVWVIWENGLIDYYGVMGTLEQSGYGVVVEL